MNKQVTPGAVGGQGEPAAGQFEEASAERNTDHAAFGSEQTQNIRNFAEHIIRELCARHNPPQNQSQ